jgi:UDP-N-acetylglucosamine 2-epimerase
VKVVTVVGARPQFVKAAPVSAALSGRADEVLVHTGQHYDAEMSDAFFAELNLRPPRHHLAVGSASHGEQTARMLAGVERVLLEERPRFVIVYGDTNSTLAGALAAAKLHIPVAHVEAGLRSFDRLMPEEVNRVVADHLSTYLFAPSPTAVANLHREGITKLVMDVGDVMVDALLRVRDRAVVPHPMLETLGLGTEPYAVATLHRASTTDDPAALSQAIEVLCSVPLPVLFPLHPRTRAALHHAGLRDRLEGATNVHLLPPVSYLTMVALVSGARAVLTDSGGLQKEAYVLGTRCLTMRTETEWVETVASGWNSLIGLDPAKALAALDADPPADRPALYGDGRASERIAAALADAPPDSG